MWTCQCPKTKRGRNKSTKQWKVIILLLVTLPLSRIVGVMVMEMAMVITDAMVTEKEWLLRVSVLLQDSEAVLSSGGHYDEEFARHDISKMLPRGEYWSLKQVEDATKGMSFPQGTTPCDKWVAFNAFANDLDGVLSDEDIIKAAYAFWFADKDWVGKWGKIWTYMCSNQAK